MRRLMVLLLVMAVAGCGDGDATETGATEQFTQGVSMEPTVRAAQVITARTVTGTYEPRRGDVVLFRSPGGLWGDRKVPLLKRVVAVGGETIACCGDSRARSNDSRCAGPVPASSVFAVMAD